MSNKLMSKVLISIAAALAISSLSAASDLAGKILTDYRSQAAKLSGDAPLWVQDRPGRSQSGRYRRLVFHPSIKDKAGQASAWRSLRAYPIAGLCVST